MSELDKYCRFGVGGRKVSASCWLKAFKFRFSSIKCTGFWDIFWQCRRDEDALAEESWIECEKLFAVSCNTSCMRCWPSTGIWFVFVFFHFSIEKANNWPDWPIFQILIIFTQQKKTFRLVEARWSRCWWLSDSSVARFNPNFIVRIDGFPFEFI